MTNKQEEIKMGNDDKQIMVLDAPELQGLEPSRAAQIKAIFEPMTEMLASFEGAYEQVQAEAAKEITKEVTEVAKRLRLDIGKIRIAAEKQRKEQKEEYLRAGQAIDGVNNILKWAVVEKENKLKEIEDHFNNLEKQRLENLQVARVESLSPYIEDANERNLASMEEDVWDTYLAAKKSDFELLEAAKKKAEEDRIAKEKAEAEEQERIRLENEALKKEAEERDRLAKVEEEKRAKAEEARLKKEQAEKDQREKAAKEEQAKRDEFDRLAKIESDKLKAELALKIEQEEAAKEAVKAQHQAELAKGDDSKIEDLINDLTDLKTKYTFKSQKNQEMYLGLAGHIDSIVERIDSR